MSMMLTGVLLPLLVGSANVQFGETREYGDWVAGCDNALTCEAVALKPENNFGKFESLVLMRSRTGGKGLDGSPLSIRLQGLSAMTDRYRILIDGKLADTGAVNQQDHQIEITSLDAIRLARGIAKGSKMRVEDGLGNVLATFSLKGSAATLRYMDTQLGLSGTREAIVARGRRTARSGMPEIPVITAARINAGGRIPGTTELVELIEDSPCADSRIGVTEDRTWPLGKQGDSERALVLLSCGSGAYNFTSAVYLATSQSGGDWKFEFAPFDVKPRSFDPGGNMPVLVNADWTPSEQTLFSFAKTRGLGDCGDSAAYVWDGDMFRLSGASIMPTCRGSLDWITVWRTKIDFVG
ncbi:MAG: DUF1176 domain-containing protein [Sphingorhabdus sp.]